MIFLGKDVFKKAISVCKRRMGVCFLLKEMFSKPLKRHGGIEERESHREGSIGSQDREREGL